MAGCYLFLLLFIMGEIQSPLLLGSQQIHICPLLNFLMIVRNCRAGWPYHELLRVTIRSDKVKRSSICRLEKKSSKPTGEPTEVTQASVVSSHTKRHMTTKTKVPVCFSHSSHCNFDKVATGSFLAPLRKFKERRGFCIVFYFVVVYFSCVIT